MASYAVNIACTGVLPQDDGHIFAQSWEFFRIASHHELILGKVAFEVLGVEVHASIDDGLHSEHSLNAIQEGFQAFLELNEGAFAALFHIDYGDEVLLTRVDGRAEVLELNERTYRRTEEMIATYRNPYSLCAIKVSQIELVDQIAAFSRLYIDERDCLVCCHFVPIDTTLIVRDIDALLNVYSMVNLLTNLIYARLRMVWQRDFRQVIGHRKGEDRVDCIALVLAFPIGKNCRNRNENGTEEQVAERHNLAILLNN